MFLFISFLGFKTYSINKNNLKKFSVFSSINYKKSFNILVLGTDVMQHKNSRTDTVMLINVDKIDKNISVLSIPRDTKIEYPNSEFKKINSVYAFENVEGLKKRVKDLLNVEIDQYIKIDLMGFVNIINILGGVELDIEEKMKYDDFAGNLHINFEKGKQKLSGIDSMKFIRYRESLKGDIGRIKRQQKFIHALFYKFFEIKTYFKIPELLDAVLKNVETDISLSTLIQLINKVLNKNESKINFYDLPGSPIYIDKISFYEANLKDNKAKNILKEFKKNEE
jgi:LCP family protein required for cell wall assembly